MAQNKLKLSYAPLEKEDIQDTIRTNSLVGKWESYSEKVASTLKDMRLIPADSPVEFVRTPVRFPRSKEHRGSEGLYYFDITKEKEIRIPSMINRVTYHDSIIEDLSERKVGDNYWKVVRTPPTKVVRLDRVSLQTDFLLKKILEENYSYLIPEIDRLGRVNAESALRTATSLEEAMNLSKLETDDPLQKRRMEDFQWDLIEIKKLCNSLLEGKDAKEVRKKLEETIETLKGKMLISEEIKNTLNELGIDSKEALKEFQIQKSAEGRVEYIWKKSG